PDHRVTGGALSRFNGGRGGRPTTCRATPPPAGDPTPAHYRHAGSAPASHRGDGAAPAGRASPADSTPAPRAARRPRPDRAGRRRPPSGGSPHLPGDLPVVGDVGGSDQGRVVVGGDRDGD